jgi:hypothetical protein
MLQNFTHSYPCEWKPCPAYHCEELTFEAWERMTDGGVNGRMSLEFVLWRAVYQLRFCHVAR